MLVMAGFFFATVFGIVIAALSDASCRVVMLWCGGCVVTVAWWCGMVWRGVAWRAMCGVRVSARCVLCVVYEYT